MQNKQSQPTIKDFVLQEAYQKGFQRLVIGLKQYEREKKKIITDKKDSLREEFDKKAKENNSQMKIHRSTKINESRMRKMNLRHDNIQELLVSAQHRLINTICKNEENYKKLLKSLIIQGLIKLFQPIVYVRCLKRDRTLVERILPECKKQFQSLVEQAGISNQVGEIDLRIDSKYTLEQRQDSKIRLTKSEESNICFGGVLLTNEDGLIVCKNTLDARLELGYQQLLPNIRKNLYGDD